jgi:hypothetical protein
MSNILYLFISHKKKYSESLQRIKKMIDRDFIIVIGGSNSTYLDVENKTLHLCCNDNYEGLPEKVIKSLEYISLDSNFNNYTHVCKLDDDMIIINKFENIDGDYMGKVQYEQGNRRWHFGKCTGDWNYREYTGEYVPWCKGGYGYILSVDVIKRIVTIENIQNHTNHIYEDLYIAQLVGIEPLNFEIDKYVVSPEHN